MKIAIASGKGGTGKTLVSTNLFYSLQMEGIPVSMVDCDAEEPNAGVFIKGGASTSFIVRQHIPVIDTEKCVFCGKCHEYCHYHAIVCLPPTRFIQVVEDLCHGCGSCLFACEYNAITEKEMDLGEITSKAMGNSTDMIEGRTRIGVFSPVPVIKKSIYTVNSGSIAILDSPPGISCPFITTVEKADFVVLVTEPTPFGLNDLKLSVATLQHLGKIFGVVVNRAGLGNLEVYKWLKEKKIPLLMEIPFDKEIARLYSEGKLISEVKPQYRQQFTALGQRIINGYSNKRPFDELIRANNTGKLAGNSSIKR
jgi:MinD superfamily P-loop ATPase